MSVLNNKIQAAINNSEIEKARELIRDAMPEANARTYQLAAQVAIDEEQRQVFLDMASELEAEASSSSTPSSEDSTTTPSSTSPSSEDSTTVLVSSAPSSEESKTTQPDPIPQAPQKSSSAPIKPARKKPSATSTKPPINHELTRLVAAGAIIFGESFRERVIAQYKLPFRAAAPEIGIDAEIVYRVSSHIQKEAKGNVWMWIGLLVLAFIIFPLAVILVPCVLIAWAFSSNNRTERIRKKYIDYFRSNQYSPERVKSTFTNYDPPANLPKDEQNVVVYRGFSPFVGAGQHLGGWSFPIDIGEYHDKTTGELVVPDDFSLSELYDAVEDHLHSLELGNLRLRDYIYAYGSDLSNRDDLLPSRDGSPRQTVDAVTIGKYMNSNQWGVRYYKWIMIYDWDGEIVISFFLRFSRRGARNLFVEFNSYMLPPLHEKFHDVDRTHESNAERLQRIAQQRKLNAQQATQSVYGAFLSNTQKVMQELRDEVMGNPRFNYGSAQSIREYSSASGYTRFFQRMDKEMYTKIFEKEIFSATNVFLKEHNVKIDDAEAAQNYIINQGIMVQGDVSGEGIAIGSGAQANKENNNFFGNAVNRLTGQGQQS